MRTLTRISLTLGFCLAVASGLSAQSTPNAESGQDFLNHATPHTFGTPDGVPPSGESACNGLNGAAHGLCTAYCEAMDCDSGSPQASSQACAKVAANFLKITGQGLPCDCPCVAGFAGFASAVSGPISGCFQIGAPGSSFDLIILQTATSFWPASEVISGFGAACGNWFDGALFINEQQGRACNAYLRNRAAAAGFACNPS